MHIRNTIRAMTLCTLTMLAGGCWMEATISKERQQQEVPEEIARRLDAEEMTRHAQKETKEMNERAKNAIADMAYVKDSRTGLCYAYIWQKEHISGSISTLHGGPALTYVPCTPEVEALLVPQSSSTGER